MKNIMSVGELFAESFFVFKKHFATLLTISLPFVLITSIYEYLVKEGVGVTYYGIIIPIFAILIIVITLYTFIVTNLAIKDDFKNDITMYIGDSHKYIATLLGSGLIYVLATILGLILFIIPGIIILLMFGFAVTAVVLKDKGVIESLNYSKFLTSGYMWSILGRAILLIILFAAFNGLLTGLFMSAGVTGIMSALGMGIYNLIATPFNYAFTAVMFYDLVKVKEGADLKSEE